MASVQFREVTKTYGAFEAIKSFDLDIEDGEFCVLVGPSGCGKSTALKMLAGLEATTSGSIQIGGRDVTDLGPGKRDIAMVFQNYALYPHMSVRQNLEYGLKNRGTPRDEIAKRVGDAARVLEIAPFLDRRPRQLSGGQRQRVAMGRAIVRQPKAFLFDEPLSNLDAKLRGQMRVEIRTLQRRLKTTSVYVTHDQLEAMTLADRLVVMNAGHIEQVGTPTELYDRPQTLFVAGFIGSPPMNFIDIADLTSENLTQLQARAPGIKTVGIRPDGLTATANPQAIRLETKVALIEPVGAESHVHVRWNNRVVVAQIHGRPGFAEGDAVTLYADPAAIHPFNADGTRIA